jgi:manganese oxidase
MHPRTPYQPHCDKDFLLHVQEYSVLPNNTVPNTTDMEYNWLVLNGKAGPASTPMIVRQGDRVRLRFVNLGMDHHPMHLHGYTFYTTGTEGGRIQPSAWWPGNTVLVGVAQARDVELVADRPGDWMLHCHLPHHMMNQMASRIGGMATTNGPLAAEKAMQGMAGMQMQPPDIGPNANTVPGFPQDAFMEGPAMAMDQRVDKPENFGLRPGWSGFMMGMMNFLRVLPPDQYDSMIARMKQAQRPNDPYASLLS